MVIDASVLANVVGDDGVVGRRARGEVRIAGDVAAPELVDVETVAVLRKRWLTGTLSDQRFAAAYVGLANGLGCELLTADCRLARAAGLHCVVRLLEP